MQHNKMRKWSENRSFLQICKIELKCGITMRYFFLCVIASENLWCWLKEICWTIGHYLFYLRFNWWGIFSRLQVNTALPLWLQVWKSYNKKRKTALKNTTYYNLITTQPYKLIIIINSLNKSNREKYLINLLKLALRHLQ